MRSHICDGALKQVSVANSPPRVATEPLKSRHYEGLLTEPRSTEEPTLLPLAANNHCCVGSLPGPAGHGAWTMAQCLVPWYTTARQRPLFLFVNVCATELYVQTWDASPPAVAAQRLAWRARYAVASPWGSPTHSEPLADDNI